MVYSNDEKAWITAHQIFLTFLKIYQNYKFWMTGNKSWDLIKWNANGNVLISEKALLNYFNDKTLTKNSKAFDYGGVRGARCFVAEHPVPTSELKRFSFEKFKTNTPDLINFKSFFSTYNRICYIWHEEDNELNKAGLRSTIKVNELSPSNMFSRYDTVDVKQISTNFKTGNELFKFLKKQRENNLCYNNVKEILKTHKNEK
jgi:hypothetical protein